MFNLGNALSIVAGGASLGPSLVDVYAEGGTVANTTYSGLPAHLAGHLVVGLGVEANGSVSVTPDASFTTLFNVIHSNSALQLAVATKFAPTDNSSFGTWTDAARVGGGIISGAASLGTPAVSNTGGTSTTWSIPPLSGLNPRSAVLFGEVHSPSVTSITGFPAEGVAVVAANAGANRSSAYLLKASDLAGGDFPGYTLTYGASCFATTWAVEVFSL